MELSDVHLFTALQDNNGDPYYLVVNDTATFQSTFTPPRYSGTGNNGVVKLRSADLYYEIVSGNITSISPTLSLVRYGTGPDLTTTIPITTTGFPLISGTGSTGTINIITPNYLSVTGGNIYNLTTNFVSDTAFGSTVKIKGVDWTYDEKITFNNYAYATRSTGGNVLLATGPTGTGIGFTEISSTGSVYNWSLTGYSGTTGIIVPATGVYRVTYVGFLDYFSTGTTVVGSILKRNTALIEKSQVTNRNTSANTVLDDIGLTLITDFTAGDVLSLWLCASTGAVRCRISNIPGGFATTNRTVFASLEIEQIS